MHEKVKGLRIPAIEKLCRAFECTPNDLFAYEGEAEAGQPMTELRAKANVDLRDVGRGVPVGRLEEFKRKVEEVKEQMKNQG